MNLPGISRPLRAAGLALIGVAVIAVAIGTVTVVTGNADDTAAPSGEQTTTTAPGEGDGGESPTATPSPSPSDPADETETETSEPDAGDGSDGSGEDGSEDGDGSGDGAGDGGDGGKAVDGPGGSGGKDDGASGKDGSSLQEMVDVRVYNNSNISGLAARAERDLEARGWDVVETGNYSDGVIYTTTVYYREGTNEEAAAQAIGDNFSMRVRPRFDGIKDASPGVIVIVTKDYEGRQSGK
ncbi:LytR C-terminal domain-containing protein [Haloechinothrix halophila]|uniref:LytR C-terminal domain-containing protein n=1 Tax=Haloechinothrix halophila TaxID=1069073 RepID=UPI00055180EC|nr:LytR C-terminal domain-containing protein [Haloechinothrix halophila]